MKLALGTVVTPNIKLIREISRGERGSVWVAHHRGLGRPVAIKFVSDKRAKDPEALTRFKREVEAVMQIRTPYVARMFENGVAGDGTPYLVMELLEGESLEERLSRQGMLTLHDAGVVLRQVGSALDAAHARGIIHRNIKPANLFLIGSDRSRLSMVKVLDFGMAKAWRRPEDEALTRAGSTVGTPEYMSPEQLLGAKDVDFRSDLWALAVVTYRMVTGELPFKAATSHALFYAVCKGSYTPVTSTAAPIELEAWFKRAFAPVKDKRFGSAREMMLRFEQIAASIEEEDEVDEHESTQLMDARRLLADAKAALASRGAPVDVDDDHLAATLQLPPDDPMAQTTDMFAEGDDDSMPTRQMGPGPAAEALRAIEQQRKARRAPQGLLALDEVGVASPRASASPPRASAPQGSLQVAPSPASSSPSHPGPSSGPISAPISAPISGPISAPISAPQAAPSAGGQLGAARLDGGPPSSGAGASAAEPQLAPPVPQVAPPVPSAPPSSASDSPWAGPESQPTLMPQRQGRGRTGVALFGATLLLLSGAAAYVATQRPDLLARLRAGGAETAADEPAGPTAEPQPPPSVTEPASEPQPSASTSSAASDTDGFLTVMCEPECAVEVDDAPVGPAPVFERALAVGKHKVTLSRPGYQSKTVRVDLRAGERETLKITMDVPIRPPRPLDDDPY